MRFALALSVLLSFGAHASDIIAISYFDNTTGDVSYNPLSKGIADMLITDLSKIEGVTIVERERLEDLLQEIELGQSKFFDQKTAQQLGKGLGARSILTGAFMVMGEELRIDARLIDVANGKIVMAEAVLGRKDDFFHLHKQLVDLLSKELKLDNSASTYVPQKKVNLDAVVQYSTAIDYADKGLNDDASELLASTVDQHPDFGFAKNRLDQLKKWLKDVEAERDRLIAEETKKLMASVDVNNAQFGQQVNQIWTSLMTSQSYSKILAFNSQLKGKGIKDDYKLYGEMSPITFGEMHMYYDCFSWYSLKNYPKTLDAGKVFIEKFPTSMYFSGVKSNMDQAIAELEAREKGRSTIDAALVYAELEVYIDVFDDFSWGSKVEFMTQDEYNFYKGLFTHRVMGFGDKQLVALVEKDEVDIGELFEFRHAAARFGDIEVLKKMAAKALELFEDGDFAEEAYHVDDQVADAIEAIGKRKIFLADAQKQLSEGTSKNVQSLARKGRQLLKAGDAQLMENIMRKFLQSEEGKEAYYRKDVWKHLVYALMLQDRMDDAKKELANYKSDGVLIADGADKHKKEFRSFRTNYNDTRKEIQRDKQATVQMKVYQKRADAYEEFHQYADEAATRKQLIDQFTLEQQQSEIQRYKLFYAYYNMGYFEEAHTAAKQLKDKHPDSSYTSALDSMLQYMPN